MFVKVIDMSLYVLYELEISKNIIQKICKKNVNTSKLCLGDLEKMLLISQSCSHK